MLPEFPEIDSVPIGPIESVTHFNEMSREVPENTGSLRVFDAGLFRDRNQPGLTSNQQVLPYSVGLTARHDRSADPAVTYCYASFWF